METTETIRFQPDWLVILHAVNEEGFPCPDAIAAHWVIDRYMKDQGADYDFRYIMTGSEAPQEAWQYQNIILADICVPKESLEKWLEAGKRVVVIDHHKTSKGVIDSVLNQPGQTLRAFFDYQECAATLAWKVLYPDEEMPAVLEYVRDRDLWDEKLPFHAEIHAAFGKLHRSFQNFDQWAVMPREVFLEFMVPYGQENADKRKALVERLSKKCWKGYMFGKPVVMLELSKSYNYLASDVGSYLCKKYPECSFAAIHKPSIQRWSLRSDKYGQNFDVEVVAACFDNGGHRNAAGLSYSRVDKLEDDVTRYVAENGVFFLVSR